MAAPVDPGNFSDHSPALADAVDLRFAPLFKALDVSKPGGGLDHFSIRDGILTYGSSLYVPDLVTSLAFNLYGNTNPLGLVKDQLGIVRIRTTQLLASAGVTATLHATFATAPVGFRPATGTTAYGVTLTTVTMGTSSQYGKFAVNGTTGAMTWENPTGSLAVGENLFLFGQWRAES